MVSFLPTTFTADGRLAKTIAVTKTTSSDFGIQCSIIRHPMPNTCKVFSYTQLQVFSGFTPRRSHCSVSFRRTLRQRLCEPRSAASDLGASDDGRHSVSPGPAAP